MQVGMIVLYVAFVPVGLWLLTEAMWQHGAPFRYRLLALIGFVGVAVGVAARNGIISGAGALCFVVGQLLVTRYVRSGYYHGWTVRFGRKRARRSRHGRAAEPAPVAEAYAEPEYDYGDHDPADYAGYGAYEQPEFPQTPEFPPYGAEDLPQPGGYPQQSDHTRHGDYPDYPPAYTPQYQVAAQDSGDSGLYAYGNPDAYHDDSAGYATVTFDSGDLGRGPHDSGFDPAGGTGQFMPAPPGAGYYEPQAAPPYPDYDPQARPMSSDTSAAPIPTPTSPPPGWAPAPTEYRPGGDERFV